MDDSLAALIFIGGLIAGIPLGWFIAQQFSGGGQHNVERWKVIRNEKGLPEEVVVHREVKS